MSKETSKAKKNSPKKPDFQVAFTKTDDGINWSPLVAVIVTVVSYIAAGVIGQLYVLVYGSVFHHWNLTQSNNWLNNSTIGQFFYGVIVYGSWIGLFYYFIKRRHSSFKNIGWIKPKWVDAAYTLSGFLVYFLAYFIILTVVSKVFPSINLNQQQDIGFQNTGHGPALILVFISLVIIPPIVEETVFRGFLYTTLRKRLSLVGAGLITSVLFAVPHLLEGVGGGVLWVGGIDTFILSLVLVYLREKTGGIWSSVGLHFVKNGIAFVSLFYFAHILV